MVQALSLKNKKELKTSGCQKDLKKYRPVRAANNNNKKEKKKKEKEKNPKSKVKTMLSLLKKYHFIIMNV